AFRLECLELSPSVHEPGPKSSEIKIPKAVLKQTTFLMFHMFVQLPFISIARVEATSPGSGCGF
ncbi:MAG: hypothetical protein WBB70_03915, partial [Desulfobacterales bacterium]